MGKVVKDDFTDAALKLSTNVADLQSKSDNSNFIDSIVEVSKKFFDLINHCNSVEKPANLKKASYWMKKEPKAKATGILSTLDEVKNIMKEKENSGQPYTKEEQQASKAASDFLGKIVENQKEWLDFLPKKVLVIKLEDAVKTKLERYQERFDSAAKEPTLKEERSGPER